MAKRIVLIVEDNPPVRDAMVRDLEGVGFTVNVASDFHGALGVLSSAVPDLVFVDLTLPRESGFDLVEKIRATAGLERIPIIVTSERGSPEDMAQAEEIGANAFLRKPFTTPLLLKYVRHILDGPNASVTGVRRLEPRPSSRRP
jgi:DNA-binding response OmpR family regulator